MADRIQLKRSDVAGLQPAASELEDGELGLNTADGSLYAKVGGTVALINPTDFVSDIVPGGANVGVVINAGVATITVSQEQADWAQSDVAAPDYIKNKPTALSQFSNDTGFVDAAGASAASPVQNILQAGAVSVSSLNGEYTISAPAQVNSDWNEADSSQPAFIENKPTALSSFSNDTQYVTSAGAAAAAPVQSVSAADGTIDVSAIAGNIAISVNRDNVAPVQAIAAGANISVVAQGGTYTISALGSGSVNSVSGQLPVRVTGSSFAPVIGVDTATPSVPGVVRFATGAELQSGASSVAVDAAALKDSLPAAVSELTNDAGFVTQGDIDYSLQGYLPLSGGTISGDFVVGASGSARAPTPADGDSSTSIATTEWVQRAIAGAELYQWLHGGSDTTADPTSGFLRVSDDNLYLAISKQSGDGLASRVASLGIGDVVFMEELPPQILFEDGNVLTGETGNSITVEQ